MRVPPLRQPSTLLVPAVALLGVAAVAGSGIGGWMTPADSAQVQRVQAVPADWAPIPSGIEPGDGFRLLFVPSATRDASSSEIAESG